MAGQFLENFSAQQQALVDGSNRFRCWMQSTSDTQGAEGEVDMDTETFFWAG